MEETENNTNNGSGRRNEVSLAIVSEKISNIEGNIKDIKNDTKTQLREIKDNTKNQFNELKSSIGGLQKSMDDGYARKADLVDTQKDVEALKSNIGWGVKIVIGGVIVAVLGLVISNRPV